MESTARRTHMEGCSLQQGVEHPGAAALRASVSAKQASPHTLLISRTHIRFRSWPGLVRLHCLSTVSTPQLGALPKYRPWSSFLTAWNPHHTSLLYTMVTRVVARGSRTAAQPVAASPPPSPTAPCWTPCTAAVSSTPRTVRWRWRRPWGCRGS